MRLEATGITVPPSKCELCKEGNSRYIIKEEAGITLCLRCLLHIGDLALIVKDHNIIAVEV